MQVGLRSEGGVISEQQVTQRVTQRVTGPLEQFFYILHSKVSTKPDKFSPRPLTDPHTGRFGPRARSTAPEDVNRA